MTERDEQIAKLVAKASQPQQPIQWSDYKTPAELARATQQADYGYPNLSPGSVLVAGIGTTWKPGAWERVVNMVQCARDRGYNAWLEEISDPLVTEPYGAVPMMMNTAVLLAQIRGFEWVCFVENDALPEPELLVNLIERNVPIVAPRVIDPAGAEETIGSPDWPPNTGLYPMKWVPFTFMLFRTTVFNCIPQPFTNNVTEGHLFLRLWYYGHRPYQDTDNPLQLASAPSYRQESYDDRTAFLRRADKARRQPPDRTPLNPSTPTAHGIYAPFLSNGVSVEVLP